MQWPLLKITNTLTIRRPVSTHEDVNSLPGMQCSFGRNEYEDSNIEFKEHIDHDHYCCIN